MNRFVKLRSNDTRPILHISSNTTKVRHFVIFVHLSVTYVTCVHLILECRRSLIFYAKVTHYTLEWRSNFEVKGHGHRKWKWRNHSSSISWWKIDQFTSNQHQDDLLPVCTFVECISPAIVVCFFNPYFCKLLKNGAPLFNLAGHTDSTPCIILQDC